MSVCRTRPLSPPPTLINSPGVSASAWSWRSRWPTTRPCSSAYTEGLVAASTIETTDERGRLRTIRGAVPGHGRFPAGCVFANRCDAATSACEVEPPWVGESVDAGYACHHPVSSGGGVDA